MHGASGHGINPLSPPNFIVRVSRWSSRRKSTGCCRTLAGMAGEPEKSLQWYGSACLCALELGVGRRKADEYFNFMAHLFYFTQHELRPQDCPFLFLSQFINFLLSNLNDSILKGLGAIWDGHQPLFCEFLQCLLWVCPCCLWFSSAPTLWQLNTAYAARYGISSLSVRVRSPAQTALTVSTALVTVGWMDLVCLTLLLGVGFSCFPPGLFVFCFFPPEFSMVLDIQ